MQNTSEHKVSDAFLLGDASQTDVIYDGGQSDGCILRVRSIKIACIDDLNGNDRIPFTCCGILTLICVLFTTITYRELFVIEKTFNPCNDPFPGLSILNFPPKNNDSSLNSTIGEIFDFEIL